jgi:hypothetical protein
MPYAYPPIPPTISGDVETINRFLQSPQVYSRYLRTVIQQRFIGDVLLSGRDAPVGGAIIFEVAESIYTDKAVEAVSPGGEYPLTTVPTGTVQVAKTVKWGQDSIVSDEAISRMRFSPVQRGTLKLGNTLVKQVDTVCLALIASAVTQTFAATASWSSTTTARILYDVLKAKATILTLNQGYSPDTLVVDDLTYAQVAADPTVVNAARREDPSNPIYTGVEGFPVLGGLRVLPTPNLPSGGGSAWVLDSSMLGGIANESLGGGYTSAGDGVESKVMRDDLTDQYRLRARRVFVPYVQEPLAGLKITGI